MLKFAEYLTDAQVEQFLEIWNSPDADKVTLPENLYRWKLVKKFLLHTLEEERFTSKFKNKAGEVVIIQERLS